METHSLPICPPGGICFRQSFLLFSLVLLTALSHGCAQPPKTAAKSAPSPARHWWPVSMEVALDRAGGNRAELLKALSDAPRSQRPGLLFLLDNMPQADLERVSAKFLLSNLAGAYATRSRVPWGKSIPEDIFLNGVLPYVNIDERREDWRQLLHDQCAPLIADCQTPAAAAQRLNEKIFPQFKVKYSTQRKKANQSPSESIASGLASCTGLSILLIDACRSVGVPARLVGTPNWIDNRGNHTWVEVWDGRWHFLGAAEPDPQGLDHAWFQGDAARAVKASPEHAIYAASFRRTGLPFPLVWAPGVEAVSAENVTDNYTSTTAPAAAQTTRLLIKVLTAANGPRVAADVTVTDTEAPAIQFTGRSRDERSDLNDLLTFEVPWHRTYRIVAHTGAKTATREFVCGTNALESIVLVLP